MMRRVRTVMALLIIGGVLLSGCASKPATTEPKPAPSQSTQAEPAKQAEARQIRIGGGSVGGVYYMVAASLGQLIEKEIPGTKCFVEGTGGSTANLQLISTGKADIGIVNNQQASMAIQGVGWAEGKDYKNFASLFPIYPSVMMIVTLNDKIKSVKDINGKAVAPGSAASDGSVVMDAICKVFNVKPSSVQYTDYSQISQLLIDKKVDVGIIVGGHPHAQTQQLEQGAQNVRYIPLSEDECKQLLQALPAWKKVVLQPEGLKYMQPGYTTIGNWSFVACRGDLEEDLVYKIVKAAWEKRDQLLSAVAALKDMKPENIPEIVQKYHPGAVRYYNEKGWKVQ
ncbi:MAG: TAXI family TRAP transporter solute-binding subunit [Bacillota bacterium]